MKEGKAELIVRAECGLIGELLKIGLDNRNLNRIHEGSLAIRDGH